MKTCPLFFNAHVQNTPSIRHFDAILTPSLLVPPAILTFKRHLPVTKANVVLMFCTYRSYIRKKPAVKTAGGTGQDGVLMATMKCARRHARGHGADRESDFWLISILWFNSRPETLKLYFSQLVPHEFQKENPSQILFASLSSADNECKCQILYLKYIQNSCPTLQELSGYSSATRLQFVAEKP